MKGMLRRIATVGACALAFAAMGTAGQRCTTLRRLFVADAVYDRFLPRLSQVYASVQIGDRAPTAPWSAL